MMKKLDEIPKKNIFKVPEGYFEKLPTVIQSRVAGEAHATAGWSWGLTLKLALPVVVFALAGIFWLRSGPERPPVDVTAELAAIAPEDLQRYIDQTESLYGSELTTDELLENPDWTNEDVKQLADSVYAGYKATAGEIEQVLDNEL